MTTEEEPMGQTIAEADAVTAAPDGPSTVRGWTKHDGVWVTDLRADDDTITALIAWGRPEPDAAMNAFRAYAATFGLDVAEEFDCDGDKTLRESWARRIPVAGGDPPVYADLADGWRLQVDACPLDADAFEVLVLEPGPRPVTTDEQENPS